MKEFPDLIDTIDLAKDSELIGITIQSVFPRFSIFERRAEGSGKTNYILQYDHNTESKTISRASEMSLKEYPGIEDWAYLDRVAEKWTSANSSRLLRWEFLLHYQ